MSMEFAYPPMGVIKEKATHAQAQRRNQLGSHLDQVFLHLFPFDDERHLEHLQIILGQEFGERNRDQAEGLARATILDLEG